MAEANTGKGSRTERVLAPEFVQELGSLTVDEVHVRRDEALAERVFQSYLRRLVQVRQDILRAERDRRASGETQAPLVERLTSVLSEGPPRGPGRGEALSLGPSGEDMAEAERIADAATGGPLVSELDTLGDAGLEEAVHAGHVVAVSADGRIVASAGDPERLLFARSSMKPLQAAVSLSLSPFAFSDREVAVMCGSHNAEPVHVEAVRSLMRRAGVAESTLRCPSRRP